MPRWLRAPLARFQRGTLLWAGMCLLLGIGILSTLLQLMSVPAAELRDANHNGQRVIIDPVTGAVSGLPQAKAEQFEVGAQEDKPAPEAPTPAAETTGQAPDDAAPLRTQPASDTLPHLEETHDSIVLPPAPEITELGAMPLPKRGDKNITAAELYARHYERQPKHAYISMVITDAGFSVPVLRQILELPHEVTVAFSPYALDPKPQIALLHTAGIETWGMLPVQTVRYPQDDPGPLGLLRGQPDAERKDRLMKVMSATIGAVGMVLPPDDALSNTDDFSSVLKEINARGLLVLSTQPSRTAQQITRDPTLQKIILRGDLVLDSTASDAFIESKLAGLRAMAEQQGNLVVLVSARPRTLALIADWVKQTPLGDNVSLAPLSVMQAPPEPPPAEVKKDDAAAPKDEAKKDDAKKDRQ